MFEDQFEPILSQIKQIKQDKIDFKQKYENEQKQTIDLNKQIADANALMATIKNEDKDYGIQIIEAQQKADGYKHFIDSLTILLGLSETNDFDSQCRDIADRIKNLQKPIDDTTKEYLKLAKALEDFFYKHKPKAKSIWKKIVNFILRR